MLGSDEALNAYLLLHQKLEEYESRPSANLLCSRSSTTLRRAASANPSRQREQKFIKKMQLSKKLMKSKIKRFSGKKQFLNVNEDLSWVGGMESEQFRHIQKSNKLVQGIKIQDILALYFAKCIDYKKQYIESQAEIFIEKIRRHVAGPLINLSQSGLGVNSVKVLKKILLNNRHFSHLIIDRNVIKDQGALQLAEIIKKSNSFIQISVASNGIGSKGTSAIFQALAKNQSLAILNFSSREGLNRNRVGLNGAFAIKYCLLNNRTLMKLDLSNIGLNFQSISVILKDFNPCSSLVWLSLARNQIGPMGGACLKELMRHVKLEYLDISFMKLEDEGIEKFVQYFEEMLKYSKDQSIQLQQLNLDGNGLTLSHLSRLIHCFKKKTNLHKLSINDNSLDDYNPNFQKLLESESFEEISLRNCQISKSSCGAIGQGISKSNHINRLVLSHNKLGKGVIQIGRSLSLCKVLIYLDLSSCSIMDEDFIFFLKQLRVGHSLKTLLLRENFIQENGGVEMAECMQENRTLIFVDLTRNFISIKTLNRIEGYTERNIEIRRHMMIPDEHNHKRRIQESRKINEERSQRQQDEHTYLMMDIEKLESKVSELVSSKMVKQLEGKLLREEKEERKVIETMEGRLSELRSEVAVLQQQIQQMEVKMEDLEGPI